ncbi:MAG: tetratricopeptide repeat protein [Mariprofundaceae bacterium]|nr:tetratricopeptide repeat protein [Mariprofundaceae bacterium]
MLNIYQRTWLIPIIMIWACFFSSSLWAADTATLAQAKADYQQGHFEEALSQLQTLVTQQPNRAEIQFYLGLTQQKMLHFNVAQQALEQCLNLQKDYPDAHSYLGEVYYTLNQFNKAISHLDQAIQQNSRIAYSSYLKGLVLIQLKQYQQAIPPLKNCVASDDRFQQKAYYALGVAYFHNGDQEKSKVFFNKASEGKQHTASAIYAKLSLDAIKEQSKKPQKDKHKEIEFMARYALSYDDNVVLKPAQISIPMSVSSQKDKRHDLTFFANWQPKLQGSWLFSADYRFHINGHLNLKQLNLQGHTLTISPSYIYQQYQIGLESTLDYYLVSSQRYVGIAGAYPYLRVTYNQEHTGEIRLGVNKQRYYITPVSAAENRDTLDSTVHYSHQYALNTDNAYLNIGLTAGISQANGNNWDHRHGMIETSIAYPFNKQISLEGYASLLRQNYQNTHSIFNVQRKENTYVFSSVLAYAPWQDWRFTLQYTRQSTRSNIAVYTYNRNIVTASVEFTY